MFLTFYHVIVSDAQFFLTFFLGLSLSQNNFPGYSLFSAHSYFPVVTYSSLFLFNRKTISRHTSEFLLIGNHWLHVSQVHLPARCSLTLPLATS